MWPLSGTTSRTTVAGVALTTVVAIARRAAAAGP